MMPGASPVDTFWKIYKNWLEYWTQRYTNNSNATFSEDLSFIKWDTCELWYYTWAANFAAKTKDFYLKWTFLYKKYWAYHETF